MPIPVTRHNAAGPRLAQRHKPMDSITNGAAISDVESCRKPMDVVAAAAAKPVARNDPRRLLVQANVTNITAITKRTRKIGPANATAAAADSALQFMGSNRSETEGSGRQ